MPKEERISFFFDQLGNSIACFKLITIWECLGIHVFDRRCFHLSSLFDIFGLIKNNRLGIAKNKYEITVNMEQQNPLENEVRTNIQTD